MIRSTLLSVLLAAAVAAVPAWGQRDFSDVQIKTTHVAGGIHMLEGAGGNIGVSAGPDGVFLIDDQFAPLTEKIRAAVAAIDERPIRFVLNTHWHGDHTGGNENLGKAGVLIVAHDNVRERMSTEQFNEFFDRTTPPSPKDALPVVTFNDTVTFHLNGEEIHAFHVPPAHTDGDSIVHFRKADVIHMGDVYFNGMYPYIDVAAGGSIDGVIAAVEGVLEKIGDATKVIPGHGPLSSKKGLEDYVSTLRSIRDTVAPMVAAGKSLEEVQAAQPTKSFDEKLGGGFLGPEQFTAIVYNSLKRN